MLCILDRRKDLISSPIPTIRKPKRQGEVNDQACNRICHQERPARGPERILHVAFYPRRPRPRNQCATCVCMYCVENQRRADERDRKPFLQKYPLSRHCEIDRDRDSDSCEQLHENENLCLHKSGTAECSRNRPSPPGIGNGALEAEQTREQEAVRHHHRIHVIERDDRWGRKVVHDPELI